MKWYIHCIKNYANFKGRARRKEFWMFILFNIIFGIAISILDRILGTVYTIDYSEMYRNIEGFNNMNFTYSFGYLYLLYNLIIILPALAVAIRRLHDVGKSGWWYFISFIPFIGFIWFIVLMCTAGNTYENEYGPDPKDPSSSNTFISE